MLAEYFLDTGPLCGKNFFYLVVSWMISLGSGKGKLVLWSSVGVFCSVGLVAFFYIALLSANLRASHQESRAVLDAQLARAYELPGDVTNISRKQYAGFEHVSMVLTDLQTTSSRCGLTVLDATSHPIETKEHTNFGEVQISTRMKGNYKDIKNVISKLLATHEGLSLDTLSFRRARATDPQLDAEVRMTFYYKKDA
jgi:hypothetical protein